MQRQEDWKKVKNILCVRLDNLGDVLMTSPAIRALKEVDPERRITLLTSGAGAAIARHIPEIDHVLVYDTAWEKSKEEQSPDSVFEIVEKLRKEKFEGAVLFNVYSQNPLPAAMLCFMAGIPMVAGYCRENPYRLITHWVPDEEPLNEIKHEVTRQVDLVKSLGAVSKNENLSVRVEQRMLAAVRKRATEAGIDLQNSVLIHPGVSEPKRQYPIGDFAKAAKRIIDELGFQVLVTGVASEKILGEEILRECGANAFNFAGNLSMEELIALIKLCPVLIANNTGPIHIASAVGTPVVVMYALTNPQHAPWNVPHKVLAFGVKESMKTKNTIINFANAKTFSGNSPWVGPDQIVDSVKELLCNPGKVEMTKVMYL